MHPQLPALSRTVLTGFIGTVSEAIDLVGQYRDGGVQLLINSDYRNDMETLKLFASEIMPRFGCQWGRRPAFAAD